MTERPEQGSITRWEEAISFGPGKIGCKLTSPNKTVAVGIIDTLFKEISFPANGGLKESDSRNKLIEINHKNIPEGLKSLGLVNYQLIGSPFNSNILWLDRNTGFTNDAINEWITESVAYITYPNKWETNTSRDAQKCAETFAQIMYDNEKGKWSIEPLTREVIGELTLTL